MGKKAEAGKDAYLNVGDDFDWTNSTAKDCDITQCDPPLEKSHYHVRAGRTTHAKVKSTAIPGQYDYQCKYKDEIQTNPKIIIS